MNCNTCGTPLPPGAANCPMCGAATPYYYSNTGTAPDAPTVVSSPYGTTPQTPPTGYGSQPYGEALPLPTPPPPPYNPPSPYPHTPYPMAPITPVPPPPQRQSTRIGVIVGVVLLVLILVGGGVFVMFQRSESQRASHISALATAHANANATATANAIVALRDPYTHRGTLLFSDPLRDNSQGHEWSEALPNCIFKGGAYHAIAPDPRYGDYCMAELTVLKDFVFEVQMQIIKGDGGGIDFRVMSSVSNKYYDLYVYHDQTYELDMVNGAASVKDLQSGTSAAIKQGLNQTNVVAVVAQGTHITVYVNQQQIASVIDSTYSQGHIGVEANTFTTNGNPTEVVYSNAKVWTL